MNGQTEIKNLLQHIQILNRLGITTSWGIISHLVVNRPYRVPYLPTKWWSFSVKSALDKNNELAHLHEYQGVFSDIAAVFIRDLTRLLPSNWSRSCWQRYRMQKVDAKHFTDYLIIDDNPLQSFNFFIRAWTLPIAFLKPKWCFDDDQCWTIKTSYIFHKLITLCVWRPYKC